MKRILEWISRESSGKRHAELQLKRNQGIGNWLLETPEFVKWKTEDPGRVLLGRGIGKYSLIEGCGDLACMAESDPLTAGAGKTYLR